MRIEAAIERGETCLPPIKKQTKCAKMTDENDAAIIKNGINGAVAGSCPIGGGGGVGQSGNTATSTAISVSRGNALNLSSSVSGTGGVNASSQRMQYGSSGGCPSAGNEPSGSQTNQDSNTVAHGNSGNISNNADSVRSPNTGFGGRLQFFKDGKFILELARAREGERSGWVSVPRKTFWPPSASTTPATNSTYPKNESSTSLSFSDDNSSIQSSPWQRDHCWKQVTPRKGVSKEMSMFFKRTKKFVLSHDGYKTAQLKRRRPHDNSICKIPFTLVKNGFIKSEFIDTDNIKKEVEDSIEDDAEENMKSKEIVDGPALKVVDGSNIKNDEKDEGRSKPKVTRAKLSTIVEKLIDRLPTGLYILSKVNPPPTSGILNHFPASVRISDVHNHQQHVSPRKRILRELEKVSLEDNSTKRSRAKANAANALTSASSQSNCSNSQIPNSTSTSAHRSTYPNSNSTNNNISQVSNGNGNATTQDSNSNNNSNRLYSSYSIHSLLGNTTSNIKSETNHKDSMDTSCLQIMLTSPNSSDTYYSNRSTYTNSGGKRKSPNYNVTPDSHNHRRSSRESPNNYGPNYQSESSLSPDPTNRYKSSGNAGPGATSFHPYLSSPKYSSNAASPTMANDNYKKTGYASGSPSHSQVTSKIPSTSRSPIVSTYSQQSPHSNKNSNLSNNRFREQSPVENSSSSSSSADRRDGTPRTVPKKTVAFRQQFSSPTSSPSVVQTASESSSIYKSPSDQKRKNSSVDEQRTLSPESSKIYQASIDQLDQHHRANVLRATPVLPPSSYYYLHSPHGSPGAHTSQSPYIPPLSYYPLHPYAAAVAALRNPLWLHYQTTGLLPGPSSRLPFPYNGESGLGPPHPAAPPGLSSMHLPSGPVPPWPSSLNLQNSATDDPVSLVNVKDEHNADVPLNLSKH